MSADQVKVSDHLFQLETSLHRREVRNSAAALSELLADDFIEFGSSGRIWDKASIIRALEQEQSDQAIVVEEFAARELAPNVFLVTYIARKSAKGSVTIASLRSSIWKLFDAKWRMVFHQGTAQPPK